MFYCPSCYKHKPDQVRSEQKSGGSYLCTVCFDKLLTHTAKRKKIKKRVDGQKLSTYIDNFFDYKQCS
jgi:hypothetical protein